MYKISVVIPIFNAEKYLKECLDSIVNQTLKDIQIILVNDGSTDSSAEICRTYLDDNRVIYYEKQNEGLAAARDDGILRAEGEFIGFVDSDDWIEPQMYEKMYAAATSTGSDIVFCNCRENADGHIFTPEMKDGFYDRKAILDEILPKSLAYITKDGNKRTIRWCNWLRIYKKETLDSFGFRFDRRFRRSQDSQLTYEAMLHCQGLYYIGEPLYHNRVVKDSLSRGYTKNMWSLYIPLIERLYKDTAEFTERDYTDQIHLRSFFFVCECIDNEFKPLCPNDKNTKIKIISEIINSSICDKFKDHIPTELLNDKLKTYYKLTETKKAEGIISYNKKCAVRKKRLSGINKIKNYITESPILGDIYKKIK